MKVKMNIKYLFVLFGLININTALAQLSPMGNMYFYNQYLGNPAMAGATEKVNLNLLFRKQFNEVPNAPIYQMFTGEFAYTDRAAVGLNVDLSKSGLINYTRIMGSYAYHLPVSNTGKLHFGVSVGVAKESINSADITAENYDPVVNRFNDRGYRLDGDFGVAFTDEKLNVQATWLNLHNQLNTDPNFVAGINYATFLTTASYKIPAGKDLTVEPKVVYRGIKGMDNIVEGGLGLTYQQKFNLFGLYHSTNNATVGLGFKYDQFNISGIYSIGPSAIRSFTGGDFEIGLGWTLKTKTK
ncbi:PorP/SprF family type IX secretion system membrane protein [Pedobacter chitinilyticus]|uniref:Type IX secretion system membrane protein PorP/SprF n=1 Tax=Pedobacter chitinilyticus TaxID=2233776 RepID=A0A3S4RRQ1_9SPHI|nr:PorP/SprF family type IX secretion system membrane protein [Pedobacter chitinilyticus]RWU08506.1 type IX secretion system membrane protein PorP/SprF [Pedobacter chitinilyticus]